MSYQPVMHTQPIAVEDSRHSSPQTQRSGSHGGTPGTKLTEFSPEDDRIEQKQRSGGSGQTPFPPAFSLKAEPGPGRLRFNSESKGLDPFTSIDFGDQTAETKPRQKLSAKAAAFMPLTSATNLFTHGNLCFGTCTGLTHKRRPQAFETASMAGPNLALNGDNEEAIRGKSSDTLTSTSGAALLHSTESDSHCLQGINFGPAPLGHQFSNNGNARYLQITGVSQALGVEELNNAFKGTTFAVPSLVVLSKFDQDTVFLQFYDLRDAWKASLELPRTKRGWAVRFVRPQDFMQVFKPKGPWTSEYEGQLAVSATFRGLEENFDPAYITLLLGDLLRAYGDIFAEKVLFKSFPTVRVRVEYFNLEVCSRVKKLDDLSVGEIMISVEDFASDLECERDNVARSDEPLIIGQDDDELETLVGGMTLADSPLQPALARGEILAAPFSHAEVYPLYPVAKHRGEPSNPSSQSQTTYLQPPSAARPLSSIPRFVLSPLSAATQASLGNMPGPMHVESMGSAIPLAYERRRRSTGNGPNSNNKVDIEKIRRGGDVRTTIMLRNIPNKMDQATLKEIVDETNRGEYDFMYLRIDFANNCNVGYAFINFVDPLAIIPFYQERAGHRWNKYKSHKEAEVSYATIQGKDCLVQKFRNSSVMLEHPSFRPKVFYTVPGTLAGEEDKFPEPDNKSKMRRSVENAAQVGLFAPRAGQYFRDEQRRRRSQFDRGTRLAEMEDYAQLGPYAQTRLQYTTGVLPVNGASRATFYM